MTLFQVTIPGKIYIKKNTQRIVGIGKMKRAIYSPKYKQWERIAFYHCKKQIRAMQNFEMLTKPIMVVCRIYLSDKRAGDLSNYLEGPFDVLTKAEVIKDDRLIHVIHAEKIFDGVPRTEIELLEPA